jgi:hypothetical protein
VFLLLRAAREHPRKAVMPALVAGIHAFAGAHEGVDGRDKSGHDDWS